MTGVTATRGGSQASRCGAGSGYRVGHQQVGDTPLVLASPSWFGHTLSSPLPPFPILPSLSPPLLPSLPPGLPRASSLYLISLTSPPLYFLSFESYHLSSSSSLSPYPSFNPSVIYIPPICRRERGSGGSGGFG